MRSMPFAPSSRALRLAAASALALTLGAAASAARAETGGPLPQGYTPDVPAPPQVAPPPAQPAQPPEVDPADQYADTDPSALTDFREPLAPYGQWVQDPTYGTLWVPDAAQVGADFAPYQTAGQWATTEDGDWLWQSDYAWGYIPFHYGRWVWSGSYWGWIPGRRYAPAWVTWRVGEGGYVGWAPLPPTWYWGGGMAVGLWTVPYAAYCFVPTNYVFYRGVSSYVVRDRGAIGHIAAGTRPYHPATPGVGPHGGYTHGPKLSEAHIPASAVPRAAAAHDARAMGFATRRATASTRAGFARPAVQGRSAAQGYSAGATHTYTLHGQPQSARAASPALRTPTQGQVFTGSHASSAGAHATPSYHAPAPAYHPPAYNSGYGSGGYGSGGFHPPQAAHPSSSSHTYTPPSVSHTSRSSGVRSGGGHHR